MRTRVSICQVSVRRHDCQLLMSSGRFRILKDWEINALDDDAVIAYAVEARRRGHPDAHDLAIDLITFRHRGRVSRRLRLAGLATDKIEDATADVIARAIGAAFDGIAPGQFFKWLDRITQYAFVDFFRAPRSRTGVDEVGFADDLDDDDGFWPAQGWEDFPHEQIEAQDAVGRALDTLDNDLHREIIELFVLRDLPAKQVAEQLATSVDNVSQVKLRFMKALAKTMRERES